MAMPTFFPYLSPPQIPKVTPPTLHPPPSRRSPPSPQPPNSAPPPLHKMAPPPTPKTSSPPPTLSPPQPRKLAPPPPTPKLAPPLPALVPPPPHIVPPPPTPRHTVIIMVFVSLGGLFFLAFIAAALCCFIKKKKMVQEDEMVNVSDHVHVHETVVPGPHGEEIVAMTINEDINVQGLMKKNEVEMLGKASGIGLTEESVASQPVRSTYHHLLDH